MSSTVPQGPYGDETATRVTCDMSFVVSEPTEIVVQVMASKSAGLVDHGFFEVLTNGQPPTSVVQLSDPEGSTMHVIGTGSGRLTVRYRARVRACAPEVPQDRRDQAAAGTDENGQRSQIWRQVYLRPSRYCPSDHLTGFAVAEFGTGPIVGARVVAITKWIRDRIDYVPGSSDVHDSAEDTLLTGVGTCRDFAHLAIALCRATGVPARFTAVYTPRSLAHGFSRRF